MKIESKKRGVGHRSAATLVEVAAQAGVSAVAASVVLNGSRTGTRVSPATRERILEAAERLQYSPNALARALRKQSTDVIAFYDAQNPRLDTRSPFSTAIMAGIQQGCEEQKKDLLIHSRVDGHSDEAIFLRLLNGQIDGLILYARTVTPLIERLVASRLPVATIVHQVPGVPSVGIDDVQGGRLLARHLADKGYRRVLYRRTEAELPSTLQARFDAFCETARDCGLTLTHSRNDGFLPDQAETAMLLASKGQRPDAVACWNDFSADGIAAFCQARSLRVPADIAIVGFDGLPSRERPSLQLTTIQAPWADVARTAVEILASQCAGRTVPSRTVLPVNLLVGQTT